MPIESSLVSRVSYKLWHIRIRKEEVCQSFQVLLENERVFPSEVLELVLSSLQTSYETVLDGFWFWRDRYLATNIIYEIGVKFYRTNAFENFL